MSPAIYDQAPPEARDPERPLLVRWGFVGADEDPFLAGARWAAGVAFDTLFGALLGSLFGAATGVERYDPASRSWVPLA